MRATTAIALVMACLCVGAGRPRAAERPVVIQAGGGALFLSSTDGPFLGRSYFVSVARPLRPWFLFGGEAVWHKLDSDRVQDFWGVSDVEPWNSFGVAATFRVQVPVRGGPAPFLLATSGTSWSSGGDVTRWSLGSPFPFVAPGPRETAWTSSVSLGLRAVLPGDWPEVELSARRSTWDSSRMPSLFEPRLALSW